MARDALAIPLSQQRAAVTLCDEKLREDPSNLFATIPAIPPSGKFRAYGDLLIVHNTFLPPQQFPLIGDGNRANAYHTRYNAPVIRHGSRQLWISFVIWLQKVLLIYLLMCIFQVYLHRTFVVQLIRRKLSI